MKLAGLFLIALFSLNTYATDFSKVCKEDIKKLGCAPLTQDEQLFCLGSKQGRLSPKCRGPMHREIENFKPVINACREQMRVICSAFPKHAMKKCAISQVEKFTGNCKKSIQTMKKD